MPSSQIYNYDIKKIEKLRNEGESIRGVARKCGWSEIGLIQWLKRNYVEIAEYKYIKK